MSALVLASVFRSLPAFAQTPGPLTLDDVVQKLQANLNTYETSIPSFLADEHIDSTMHQFASRGPGAANYETIAESVFRLRREIDPTDQRRVLNESREIRIIDGKPANGRDIDAPTMFSGAFSGGLAIVSNDELACMRYQLEPVKPHKPIVVRFTSVPAPQRPHDCILSEDASGRVTVDRESMQVRRIDIKVPHHVMIPTTSDGRKTAPVLCVWEIQVDFSPIALNGRTFWLPAVIASTSKNDLVEWSFRATYRNYHLLEVHSRVVVPKDSTTP